MLNNDKYIHDKLLWARDYIKQNVGLKPCYFEKDIFKILTTFGFVETLDFDELPNYIPSKGYDLSSIETFTNGFIKNNNYRIYALILEKHFSLFVVSFNIYKEMEEYYSVTINENTLKICFILEQMKVSSNLED